jgi:hypothetical protein
MKVIAAARSATLVYRIDTPTGSLVPDQII